jgi:outer membrane protein OmpA-like peptidoglycan-associated protein
MRSATTTNLILAALAGGLLAAGCATKKHVRNTVAPLEQRLSANEKKLEAHSQSIEELAAGVSRADERAAGAQGTADRAWKQANDATALAKDAASRADQAHVAAGQGLARAAELDAKLEAALANIENYTPVANVSVLFPLNKAELTPEAKQQLDEAVKAVAGRKHIVIEVQGFTDASGSREFNLALSEKRADAVVRYLTATHNLPLRSIHRLGFGPEAPAADNRTREGRKLNRRVEVRLLAFDFGDAFKTTASAVPPQP